MKLGVLPKIGQQTMHVGGLMTGRADLWGGGLLFDVAVLADHLLIRPMKIVIGLTGRRSGEKTRGAP
jgi:hypothetical protein